MKTFWKWAAILVGIFLVVFLGASLVFSRMFFGFPMRGRMPMMGGGFGFGRGMPFYGGFGGGVMIIGRFLLPLILIALLVLIGFAIGRRARPATVQAGPTQFVQSPPVPPTPVQAEPIPAEPVVAQSESTCGHCGKPLQPEWNTCPYCGAKIEPGIPS